MWRVGILSGDKDMYQLVKRNRVVMFQLGGNRWMGVPTRKYASANTERLTPKSIKDKLGVEPSQVADYLALCGDTSDNYPGVKGVGAKGAAALLQQFGSLDNIFQSLDKIPQAGLRKKLEAGRADAELSRKLSGIDCNVQLSLGVDDLKLAGVCLATFTELLEKLEFKIFVKKIPDITASLGTRPLPSGSCDNTHVSDTVPSTRANTSGESADTAVDGNITSGIASSKVVAGVNGVGLQGRSAGERGDDVLGGQAGLQTSKRLDKSKAEPAGVEARQAGGHGRDAEEVSAIDSTLVDGTLEVDMLKRVAEMAGVVEAWRASGLPEQWEAFMSSVGELRMQEHASCEELPSSKFPLPPAWSFSFEAQERPGFSGVFHAAVCFQGGGGSDTSSTPKVISISLPVPASGSGASTYHSEDAEGSGRVQSSSQASSSRSRSRASSRGKIPTPRKTGSVPAMADTGLAASSGGNSAADKEEIFAAWAAFIRLLRETCGVPMLCHDAKSAAMLLRRLGLVQSDVRHTVDVMLASYVLNPDAGTYDLPSMTARHLGQSLEDMDEAVPPQVLQSGPGCDVSRRAVATWRLGQELMTSLLRHPQLLRLLLKLEMPLQQVLVDMQHTGISLDTAAVELLKKEAAAELVSIQQEVELLSANINLSSPRQLSRLLFEELKLDTKKSRSTSNGWSTDQAVLESLKADHPIVDVLLQHRSLSKVTSTYLNPLVAAISPSTGRIHTTLNQTGTSTGRLSSSHPNLQNIPVKGAMGRRVRSAFVPRPGWMLASADYSQIELRLLAHFSGEPHLVDAFMRGEDVHSLTARLLLDANSVTPDQRRIGKTINFGVLYGMGPNRLAKDMQMPLKAARKFVETFYSRFPGVFSYMESSKRGAISRGYVETLMGRRRPFTFQTDMLRKLQGTPQDQIDLTALSKMGAADAALLRAAANTPLQGSAADIIKMAMLRLDGQLGTGGFQSKMLLQVHDELVLEVEPSEWAELEPLVRSAMETVVELKVPLVVDVATGSNWQME